MSFLRNRTVIGVFCILLSVLICFGLTPLFNRAVSQKVEIVRVTQPIRAGEQITDDSFIVAKTGVHPMKVKLRLFLDWGIRFGEPYEVPEKAQRAVAYADKQELEESIIRRHYGTVAEEEPPQDVPAAVGGMNHGMQAEKNSRKTILRP